MTDNTPPVGHCQCAACKGGTIHASDCSVHNAPALPVGACDCEHSAPPLPDERIEELAAQMEASDPTDSFWKTFARSVEAEARAPLLAEIERLKAQVAELQKDATPDQIIELTQALEIRRILEEIKEAASIMPQSDMPTQFASGWHEACAEIFYRATGCQWHMDEDDEKFKTNKEQK